MANLPSYEDLQERVAQLEKQLAARSCDVEIEKSHQRLLTILDSLDAIVYVADMQTYELLYLNTYAKGLFGDITGKTCWQSLQNGQSGPCPFCTNHLLIDAEGKPLAPHVWEFQNTITKQWFYITDKAIEWVDGRIVRLEIASDITAKNNAEAALAESERRFRAIFDNAFQFVGLLTPEGILLEANQASLDFAGLRKEEVLGKPFWETPWWNHSASLQQELRDCIKRAGGGEFCRLRATHPAADGSLGHVDFSIKPVRDAHGNVTLLIPEGRNITEHILAQQQLAESELKFRAVFNQAFHFAGILTPEGTVIAVNDTALSFAGITEEEVVGKPFWETPWWAHSSRVQAELREALRQAAAGETVGFVTTHYDRNNDLRFVDFVIKSIKNDEGVVLYLVPEGRDITESIQTEEALRASEEQYRSIFEAAQDGFFIMDLAGKIIGVNASTCRMHGYSREELLSVDPLQVVHPDFQKYFAIMLAELNQGKPFHMEGCHLRKDGTPFEVDIHLQPFSYQGRPHIFGVVRDISAQKQAQSENTRLEMQLRQAQKMEAIGTLAGGIAHDFNNILTAIMGYTDLAMYLLPKESQAREHLQAVSKAGFRARDLIKQILAFSRQAEADRIPLQISSVVKEVLKLLRASLPTTVEIRRQICDEVGIIMADPTQIHQVLMNLCSNAADAMEETGGILEVELCNVEDGGKQYVQLSIRDTGKGVEPELQERIFEPFFTTKSKGRGTGMGLAVVHGIVQSHDGRISMESTPGQGTLFRLRFPAVQAERAISGIDTTPPPSGSEHILVVDDEEAVVNLEREMLESLGYRVTALSDALAAIELFAKTPEDFDLVLTDQTMPLLPGSALLKQLFKVRPDIPVILCTGYSSVMDEKKAAEIGARRFLMKPFDIRRLALMIREVLDEGK